METYNAKHITTNVDHTLYADQKNKRTSWQREVILNKS